MAEPIPALIHVLIPGRKGKLARTSYFFTPIGYREFHRVCSKALGANLLPAYLISGRSPIGLGEIASHGRLPEYVPELVRDWICGEAAATGCSRISLVAVMESGA